MTNKEAINILINTIQPPIIRNDGKSWAHLLALEAIQKAVIALEVTDVVRCKDCKHFVTYNDGIRDCKYLVVRMFAEGELNNKPNDFCCWGERKDEEDTD